MTTERLQPFPKSDVRYWKGRIFKHTRATDGRIYTDADYSVQIAHQKRRHIFQLGTSDAREAARGAQRIYASLKAVGWEQTLQRLKAQEPLKTNKQATIGEFLSQLRTLHASKAKTIDNYAGSLRRIASDIAGIPSGGRGGDVRNHREWRAKIDALQLSILTPPEIQKWKENFLARGTDPVKQRSARVSVNTFLRDARSLFSPKYLEGVDRTLLPEQLPFTGIKLERRSMPRYQSSFDVMELVKAATEELATAEPEAFKVFVLAVTAGLRRNEIDKLEWGRFNFQAGIINITPTTFFRTKSEDSTRSVWIPPQMLEIFRGYRARAFGRFVIESSVAPAIGKHYDHYRCQATFDKLIGWLRTRGVGGEKPLHTLRKEFGSLIAVKFGIYAAKEMLGHADITTTAAHYLEAKEKPVIGLGHLLPPGSS